MSVRTYHVLPVEHRWQVICNGRPLDAFADREAALEFVRLRSRRDQRARVVVHSWFYDLEQEVLIGEDEGDHGTIRWSAR